MGLAAAYGSRVGQQTISRLPGGAARILQVVLTLIGTAVVVFGIGYGLYLLVGLSGLYVFFIAMALNPFLLCSLRDELLR